MLSKLIQLFINYRKTNEYLNYDYVIILKTSDVFYWH